MPRSRSRSPGGSSRHKHRTKHKKHRRLCLLRAFNEVVTVVGSPKKMILMLFLAFASRSRSKSRERDRKSSRRSRSPAEGPKPRTTRRSPSQSPERVDIFGRTVSRREQAAATAKKKVISKIFFIETSRTEFGQ